VHLDNVVMWCLENVLPCRFVATQPTAL